MPLITTKAAAEILGISPSRVRQLIQQGSITSEKQGRDHLLDYDLVRKFNQSGRLPRGRPRKNAE
jgi:excisionase family DNA binding protein